jgi:hypothetical protein
MRKAFALSLMALVLVVLLAVLALIEISHPADWQDVLDEYVQRYGDKGQQVTVVSIERARHADLFSEDLSRAVLRDDVYYPYSSLPSPPGKVWCVLVGRKYVAGQRASKQMLFVALHQDLHTADWVVHEGEMAPFSQLFRERLERIGCDPGLGY